MLDRTGDAGGNRWRGRVVNVMDPKKQGRIQVRVFGLHDNESLIPDSDLRWASVVLPINSGASYRGVGASPVGVIPGTIVEGYFADSNRTILRATGVSPSAGRIRSSETIDGSYAIDDGYNDVANAARGSDLNAALGLKNIVALSQVGAVFPYASSGLGSLVDHTSPALALMSQTDPLNMSGSMSNSITGFSKSYAVNSLSYLAESYPGGMTGITQTLLLLQTGSITITSLPLAMQALIGYYPSGLTGLLSLTSLLSASPLSAIGAASSLIQQTIGIAGGFSDSLLSVVNQAVSSLAIASKRREFAIEAAAPTPPPLPQVPDTTSSTAPTSSSGAGNPYANIQTVELPPPVTSTDYLNSLIDKPQENAAVTTGDVLKIAPVENIPQTNPVFSQDDNVNIMQQIILREQGFTGESGTPGLTAG